MPTIPTQTFVAQLVTIAPEEPASLSMALVAVGAMIGFGALSGWRIRRSSDRAAAKLRLTHKPAKTGNSPRIRYAA